MHVLFVSSGTSGGEISTIVQNQGDSLIRQGIDISYFKITHKGLFGYLRSIIPLRRFIRRISPDLVHAHYSFSGIIASLSGAKPLIVSLMGSDIEGGFAYRLSLKIFCKHIWSKVIVKSLRMKDYIGVDSILVIPNGVNLEIFRLVKENVAKKILNWSPQKKNVLFAADHARPEKNYTLFYTAIKILDEPNLEVKILRDIPHSEVYLYLCASDVVVLPSKREGSPNVIKEAMACNCPIVATDVGDITEIIGSTEGCYISNPDPVDLADKISKSLKFAQRTKGRNAILHLREEFIAKRIINEYKDTKSLYT